MSNPSPHLQSLEPVLYHCHVCRKEVVVRNSGYLPESTRCVTANCAGEMRRGPLTETQHPAWVWNASAKRLEPLYQGRADIGVYLCTVCKRSVIVKLPSATTLTPPATCPLRKPGGVERCSGFMYFSGIVARGSAPAYSLRARSDRGNYHDPAWVLEPLNPPEEKGTSTAEAEPADGAIPNASEIRNLLHRGQAMVAEAFALTERLCPQHQMTAQHRNDLERLLTIAIYDVLQDEFPERVIEALLPLPSGADVERFAAWLYERECQRIVKDAQEHGLDADLPPWEELHRHHFRCSELECQCQEIWLRQASGALEYLREVLRWTPPDSPTPS